MLKLLYGIVEINNTGVITAQNLALIMRVQVIPPTQLI